MLIQLVKKVPNLVKDGYSLLMLTPETQNLLESGESRKIMGKNIGNVSNRKENYNATLTTTILSTMTINKNQ